MNNSTLLAADRATHLRIVVVALVCATLIGGFGLAARLTNAAEPEATIALVKPAKPVTAEADGRSIR